MLVSRIVAALCIVALSACSTPPQKPAATARGDYSYTKQYMTWLIEQEMDDADVTGLSIALVDDQQVVWQQGFGYADRKANVKATPDTAYHLGSIAKVFTATAAMQLAEQGKLNIDRPLRQYLPEFSIRSRVGSIDKITPRNIMTHHSGLPCNWVHGMSERHPGPFTAVVTAVKDEYMAYPPDYVFAYSNLGVTLLGAAIEALGGECYASYMNSHLLQPLGMAHSEFAPRIPGKSYDKGREVEAIPLRDLPSGGLISSASDIAHFMQMVFADGKYDGKQILQPESLREMFRAQNANMPMDFDFRMGLGWMLSGVDVPNAGTVASHGGTTLNYHTLLVVLPEHKLGVVVLSNSTTAQGVVDRIATGTLKLALEAKRGIAQSVQVVRDVKEVPLTEEDIHAYDGYFDTLIGLVRVSGKSGDLVAEVMGQKLELIPREGKQFGARFKLFGFIPLKIGVLEELNLSLHKIDGHDVLALKSNGQTMLIGEKIVPVDIPPHMLAYVGAYEIVNKHDGPLPESVRVLHEDGMLVGAFTFVEKPGFVFRVALKPVADDELVMAGLGPGKGETLHLKKIGEEARIDFSGFELRKKPENRD
ncbi:MAG: serine hydrolase domain-containing protein [Sideroxyarcus sp.]|nr:serine hydrolase domain-containing protein [Sideroxyarcus sp.]